MALHDLVLSLSPDALDILDRDTGVALFHAAAEGLLSRIVVDCCIRIVTCGPSS